MFVEMFFLFFFFFFNDTATTEIYTLSLHDALPIYALFATLIAAAALESIGGLCLGCELFALLIRVGVVPDRKSTRLNSSHLVISYAVFCLKKKKPAIDTLHPTVVQNSCTTSISPRC